MAMSPYYKALRDKVGNGLLLIPAVAAIVRDGEGKVLIQGRPEGGFSLPAGAIEPGETPEQAIVREVREETGFDVRPIKLLGVFGGEAYRTRYPNGDIVEYTVALYECRILGGALRLGEETKALDLYAPEDIPPLTTEYPRSLFVP